MKKFIGDLSRQDAELLERYASRARRVLEFGAGGSTQILAQAIRRGGTLVSVETDPAWIEVTRGHLRKLRVEDRCRFVPWQGWLEAATAISPRFDLVLDDGADQHRRAFALESWRLLEPDGLMLFHDTRRPQDVANVAALLQASFEEIRDVCVNQTFDAVASNLSVVRKKQREPYVDWNVVEGKPSWMYRGVEPVPDEFWDG